MRLQYTCAYRYGLKSTCGSHAWALSEGEERRGRVCVCVCVLCVVCVCVCCVCVLCVCVVCVCCVCVCVVCVLCVCVLCVCVLCGCVVCVCVLCVCVCFSKNITFNFLLHHNFKLCITIDLRAHVAHQSANQGNFRHALGPR